MEKIIDKLKELEACDPAIKWLENYDGHAKEAWNKCERGDWMAWLISELQADKILSYRLKYKFAALAIPYMKDERSVNAMNVLKKYIDGNATKQELKATAAYATDAATDADADAPTDADAVYAAAAANAAAYATAANANAYGTYATAYATANADAARLTTLKKIADYCRAEVSYEYLILLSNEKK